MTSRDARGRERYIPFPAVHVLAKDGPFLDVCGYNGGGILAVEAIGSPTQILVAFVSGGQMIHLSSVPVSRLRLILSFLRKAYLRLAERAVEFHPSARLVAS